MQGICVVLAVVPQSCTARTVGVTGRPERILHVCTREDAWVAASKRLDTFTSGVSQVTFNANVQSAATLSRHGTEDALAGRSRTLGEVCSWPISEIDELPRLSLRSQLGCSAHASLTVPRTEYLALRAEYFWTPSLSTDFDLRTSCGRRPNGLVYGAIDPERPNGGPTKRTLTVREAVAPIPKMSGANGAQTRIAPLARSKEVPLVGRNAHQGRSVTALRQ